MHLKYSLAVLPVLVGIYLAGAAIGVVKLRDNRQYDSWKTDLVGLGIRDGDGNPVDHTTLFSIASNTKLFTAINVGLAIANETTNPAPRLKWETKLKDIFPEWKLMDPVASGLTDMEDLLTEFRRAWQYNNIPYRIASAIPETLYGTAFTEYTHEHILQKLGMNDTYLDEDLHVATRTGRRSQGFARKDQEVAACAEDEARHGFSDECLGTKVNIGHFDPSLEKAAGHWGIVSSVKDMSTWLQVLLLRGRSPHTNETIIPESVIEMTSTPHSIPVENPLFDFPELGKITYGLGQQMNTYRGHRVIEHVGTMPGQVSRILRLPDLGIGVVVMVNDHELGFLFAMIASWGIMDHMLGLKPINWERRMKPLLTQGMLPSAPRRQLALETPSEIPNANFQGIYHNPAYGNLVLCAAPLPSSIGIPPSSKVDVKCRQIMSNHPFSARQLSAPATYVGHYEGPDTMYLRFSHVNASRYSASLGQVFPQTGEKLPSTYGTWDAVISPDGIAYDGNPWGAPTGQLTGLAAMGLDSGGLRRIAEVWFDKMPAQL
ncbi:hypothetical protein QFC20_006500 [Naganishia adeliensis]|uniref:Uncharacterized protein n=1 Tax=Naganishia adeliensis TaxID=92952 RepID=A0ACC2VAJ6_9TREE|nr:hypothetical protein QFC20_006500 [Naganishia adeliensis]